MITPIDPAMRRRVVWASTIGNAFEWFDFTVFGLFAGAIGAKFFPGDDPTASMLKAYGLLGVAYFFRPVGGIVFGVWADRIGRKRALIAIVMSMALGTFAIGIMPTYAQIGVAAPILLLIARLVQGFSAGGEFGASTSMLVEFAPENRRGFYASFQFVAQGSAFVIGSGFAYLVSTVLTKEQAADWGWRLPFLFGIIVAPVGFYLRSRIDETPAFRQFIAERAGVPNTPFREAIARYPREIVSLFLMIAGITAFTYIANIFLTNFASHDLGLQPSDVLKGLFFANLVYTILMPFAAALSDRFGRVAVITPGILVFLAVYMPLAYMLCAAPTTLGLWILQGSGILIMFVIAPFAALGVERFPVGVRSTGASIMYNLGVAIFGGLSPYVTSQLVVATGSRFAPFLYLSFCLVLTLIGLAILPKKRV